MAKKRRKSSSKTKSCAGLVKSGKKKGKLKKGYKWKRGSSCPVRVSK